MSGCVLHAPLVPSFSPPGPLLGRSPLLAQRCTHSLALPRRRAFLGAAIPALRAMKLSVLYKTSYRVRGDEHNKYLWFGHTPMAAMPFSRHRIPVLSIQGNSCAGCSWGAQQSSAGGDCPNVPDFIVVAVDTATVPAALRDLTCVFFPGLSLAFPLTLTAAVQRICRRPLTPTLALAHVATTTTAYLSTNIV